MSAFGDLEPGADTHDDAPPDPDAEARILWGLLVKHHPSRFAPWDRHSTADRALIVVAVAEWLQRLRDEGPAR